MHPWEWRLVCDPHVEQRKPSSRKNPENYTVNIGVHHAKRLYSIRIGLQVVLASDVPNVPQLGDVRNVAFSRNVVHSSNDFYFQTTFKVENLLRNVNI